MESPEGNALRVPSFLIPWEKTVDPKYNEDVILEACVVPDLHSLRSQLQDLLRQGHKGIPLKVHEGVLWSGLFNR